MSQESRQPAKILSLNCIQMAPKGMADTMTDGPSIPGPGKAAEHHGQVQGV